MRHTPVRENDFAKSQPAWCTRLSALTGCLPVGSALPAGWRRDAPPGSGTGSRLVLPPAGHPFWRSEDVAEQTVAMFESLTDEGEAVSAELATALVRFEPVGKGCCAAQLRPGAYRRWRAALTRGLGGCRTAKRA